MSKEVKHVRALCNRKVPFKSEFLLASLFTSGPLVPATTPELIILLRAAFPSNPRSAYFAVSPLQIFFFFFFKLRISRRTIPFKGISYVPVIFHHILVARCLLSFLANQQVQQSLRVG